MWRKMEGSGSLLDVNTLTWFQLFSPAGFRDNSGEHVNGGTIRTVSTQSRCKVNFPPRPKNALFVEVEVLLQDPSVFRLSLEDGVTQGPPAWTPTDSDTV